MSSTPRLGKESWMRRYQQQPGTMAIGIGSRIDDEEARAEVEVLNSRLDKTSQLTKRIQASLNRLEASGQSLGDAIKPLSVKTQTLQIQGRNIDNILSAINRVRQPSDIKNDDQQIIQRGPDSVGIPKYLDTVKRVGAALSDLQKTNLKSNQQAISNLSSLLQRGNAQIEKQYEIELRKQPDRVEVLQYTMRSDPAPRLEPRIKDNLRMIGNYIMRTRSQGEPPVVKMYTKIRGEYLVNSLQNSSLASLSSAKNKRAGEIYRVGTNGIDMYAKAMDALFAAEHDNITELFPQSEWGNVLNLTCQGAISDVSRTIRELSSMIRTNMSTDCYLAYEIIDEMTRLSSSLEARTNDLKPSLVAAMKPARDTGKASLTEFLDDTRRKVSGLQTLPNDGSHVQVTAEVMARLQKMAEFIGPVSSIMISIGDGGWKSTAQANSSSNSVPSLNSFDVTADGQHIFANYCYDTVELLLTSLDAKARQALKKYAQGVFIANNAIIVERMINGTSLEPYLGPRMKEIDKFIKVGLSNYTSAWNDAAKLIMEVQKSSRVRPTSGGAGNESAAIVKSMGTTEKNAIKEKFKEFNAAFDDLVIKHNTLKLEPELSQMCVRQLRDTIERLYGRFWDRYHEIDKGKGKHVKYDKEGIARVFAMM